ncbi:hypothetical protein [Thalassotalea agarivorans]|nr:hypothetical protein [Thalassotalea agarivorans]
MEEQDTRTISVEFRLPDGSKVLPADVDIQWFAAGSKTNNIQLSGTTSETVTITAVGALGVHPLVIRARPINNNEGFTNAIKQFNIDVKKSSVPSITSQSVFQSALTNKNLQLTTLLDKNSGDNARGTLQGPALTGGVPPYTYKWSSPNGVSISDISSKNPTFEITRPNSDCTFVDGTLTFTASDSAGQSVTGQLRYKLTRQAANVAVEPSSCHLCRGPKFICERSYIPKKCDNGTQQYCVNDVENLIDGSRYVTRRCATAAEAEAAILGGGKHLLGFQGQVHR